MNWYKQIFVGNSPSTHFLIKFDLKTVKFDEIVEKVGFCATTFIILVLKVFNLY